MTTKITDKENKMAELVIECAKNPKLAETLMTIVYKPKRAIESLDVLIRSNSISEDTRMKYQDLRNAIEIYMIEENKK